MCVWMNRWVCGMMNGSMDRWVGGWVFKNYHLIYGCMGRWADGWMDG